VEALEDQVDLLASSDGQPVALHDFGGRGPVLLLGHGNGLNAGMWVATIERLRHRFHCYGIDLRGHGACRPTDPDYAVGRDRFAEDILACIAALGDRPVLYGGHSLGGAAAVHAALRRPEIFDGMWLFEPVVLPDDFARPSAAAPSFLVEASRRRRMEFDSVDDAVERLRSKPPFASCDPGAVRAYVEIGTYPIGGGRVRLSCRGEDEARVFATVDTVDLGRLASIAIPTVIATGGTVDEAHAVPAQLAELLAGALGNARLERHPQVSHFGPMEAPEAMAASIIGHFASLAPSPGC
jgi:pimeloyl-ACP methyl ester carboxylesterase